MASKGSYGYDVTFSLNDYNKPKVLTESEMIKNTIMFILFASPGQYPSMPQIGIQIDRLLFEFYDDIDTNVIAENLKQQCNALGVYFESNNIIISKTLYKNTPSLLIKIQGITAVMTGTNETSSVSYNIGLTYDELKELMYDIVEL